jgi:hypothetical protein
MTGGVTMAANFTSTTGGGGGGGGGGVVPPGCTGLTPTTNYEARTSLGPQSQSTKMVAVQGTVYSFPLPTNSGGFGTSTTVYTPGSMSVEIAISQCPGDMSYYNSAPAKVTLWGIVQTPCGGIFGAESGGVNWSTATQPYQAFCVTPTGQNWYINLRVPSGCYTGSCEFYYFWKP